MFGRELVMVTIRKEKCLQIQAYIYTKSICRLRNFKGLKNFWLEWKEME